MKIRSISSLVSAWQAILLVVAVVFVIIGIWHDPGQPNSNLAASAGASQLSVGSASYQKLSSNTLTADTPPDSVTANIQSQAPNQNEASTQPLQSNTNINDPNVKNSPLVESLESQTAQ